MAGENNNLYLDTLYKLDAETKIDYFAILYGDDSIRSNILGNIENPEYLDEYRVKITDKYYKKIPR